MKRSNRMLLLISIITSIALLAVIANIFIVCVFHYHLNSRTSFESYISSVSMVNESIHAKRGTIYDAGGEVVAQDQKTYDIICFLDKNRLGNKNRPAYVDDPLKTAAALAPILDMDQQDIFFYLTNNPDLYQTELGMKGRNLSEETRDKIIALDLNGIGFRESYKRIYPYGTQFAPYLLGFAQNDDNGDLVGKMGVESYLDEYLQGVDGKHIYQRDKNGYILSGMYEETTEAQNGCDVYLTLDASIQGAMETAIDEVFEENGASKAWGSVVELSTGKILAWGQGPSFDPNIREIEDYNNYGSQLAYEPGSVMKAIIYSAAMDMGVYEGETLFDSDPFCYYSNGSAPYRTYGGASYGCIHNAARKTWGMISFDTGLIYSSNVATSTLLCDYVGVDNYLEYVKKFGFFQKVGTDGIGETTGVQNYVYPSEKLAMTYGQGSSVTMLQLLQAYSAIFGNGEALKPYIIDKIVKNGETVYQGERTVASTPIKESTARQMQKLLRRVVSEPNGTAKFYAVDEVNIMAKTGTSELIESGSYSSDDSITSVMLAFPEDHPQYMIYFAYISPYDYYNHTFSSPVQNLIRRVAILTEVGYNPEAQQVNDPIVIQEMPNVINLETSAALEALQAYDTVVIGNGMQVISQYPSEGESSYTGQKVFLLTEGSIELPDFTGWTRKEVINFWSLSGLTITLNDYGVAVSQSISPGVTVKKGEEIIVNFENIDSAVNLNKVEEEE